MNTTSDCRFKTCLIALSIIVGVQSAPLLASAGYLTDKDGYRLPVMRKTAVGATKDESELGKLLDKSRVLFEEGKLDDCEAVLKKVLEQDKDNAAALNNMGAVMARRQNYTEAKALFQKALPLARVARPNQVCDLFGQIKSVFPEDWEYWEMSLESAILNNIDWVKAKASETPPTVNK